MFLPLVQADKVLAGDEPVDMRHHESCLKFGFLKAPRECRLAILRIFMPSIQPGLGFHVCLMAHSQPNLEAQNARKKLIVNEFPSLADFIAKDKERSTSVFRSYYRLTSLNLLYLKAELFGLEKRQDELDGQDLQGDLTSKQYARDSSMLNTSDDERCVERRELFTMCRAKIKEYRKYYVVPVYTKNKDLEHHQLALVTFCCLESQPESD
jgi:hypothetical protein